MNIGNARGRTESFKAYRARRREVAQQIKEHLRGKLVHESSSIVTLPPLGEDLKADAAVIAGQVRDVALRTLPNGKVVRVGRTKGATYRRPE